MYTHIYGDEGASDYLLYCGMKSIPMPCSQIQSGVGAVTINKFKVNRKMHHCELEKLRAFYASYMDSDLGKLAEIYDENVRFQDPLHVIEGRAALHAYFEHGRSGLTHCSFRFSSEIVTANRAVLEWTMSFAHARLNRDSIDVKGCSLLTFNDQSKRVVAHTDYFDVGEMVYENVPLLGGIVRRIKRGLAGG